MQDVWLVLALITVFLGSMLAYQEKVLKKRLAYSTVSQAILYSVRAWPSLKPVAMAGSLLHVVIPLR